MKFLLETAAAAWGMDNFNEYLNGSKFTLYHDTTTETTLGTTQIKTLNRLQTAMNDHDFEIKDRQRSDLPNFLRKGQNLEKPRHPRQDQIFNRNIHVDLIDTWTNPGKMIISITDDSRTFTTSAVISDSGIDSTISAIWNYWCKPHGFPESISFKQDKVQTSKLENRINDLAPLKQRISCQSRRDPFNPETEQQWQQNQNEICEEEFIHTLNFLYDFQKPARTKPSDDKPKHFDAHDEDLTDVEDFPGDRDEPEDKFKDLPQPDDDQPNYLSKRKHVSLCQHKLQRRANCQSRSWRSTTDQQPRITEFEEEDTDHEMAKLREMEKILERQKRSS